MLQRPQRDVEMKPALSQAELVRRGFSAAEGYAQLYEGSTPHAAFFNERLRLVLEFLAPIANGRALEVGCGPGILLKRLAGTPLEVFGLDLTPEMIAEAKIRTAGCNVNLAVGQLAQLPYRDNSFDVILVLGVLEYLPDQSAALIEIARVAKRDAVVILSMLNKHSLYRWWERVVYGSWNRFKSHIAGRGTRQEPAMWLHGQKSLTKLMKARQLEPIDAIYFGLNVCVAPFDLKYPEQASALNRWARMRSARWFFPVVHAGFLIRARKCA